MLFNKRVVIIIFTLCFTQLNADYSNYGSVFFDPVNGLYFVPNVINKTDSIAYGTYNDSVETNGWGILTIKAGYGNTENFKGTSVERNNLTMQAAGFLEGYLTANRIQQHAANMYDYFFVRSIKNNQTKKNIIDFLTNQNLWMREQTRKDSSPIWRHVSYIVSQYDGLIQGYNTAAVDSKLRNVSNLEFDIVNAAGDLLDLEDALNPDRELKFRNIEKDQLDALLFKETHCSVLIKLLPGYENIYMSHSTWFTYQSMLRIYKHYDFNLDDPDTAAKGVSFSSYPGQLSSWDDFYLMSNNLVMLQTTNQIFNTSLYDLVVPESLFAWHRVRIANMLAQNGKQWSNVIAQYNSGTYNNQYMVIDLSKISLNQSVDDDALWVSEQIPGLVVSGDQTDILRAGYWASYNVPFYEQIFNLSGYPQVVEKYGPEYTHELAPRAKIFRRDQANVRDLETMKKMMRYNNYKNEIYSDGNACKTICCRGDITGTSDGGCTDTKITDYLNAQIRNAYIVNGPSTDGDLEPFSWSEFSDIVHEGMPETFNFSFITTMPDL